MKQKYSSYKDSEVEWIGEIPSHWEAIRLGVLGDFTSSGIDKKIVDGEQLVRMVNYTDIIRSRVHYPVLNEDLEFMLVSSPQTKIIEHSLKKGDLVFIPSSETDEDLGVSSLVDFDDEVVYSYHIIRFQFKKSVLHYFKKYIGNHYGVWKQFSQEGKGTTRQIIGRNVFRNTVVVLPPLPEQQQIVTYLDQKTSQIDTFVSLTEKKIELLKEKRSSLINEVVTKGLDKKVKMKDSGVEWIGEIPEGWECRLGTTIGGFFKGKGIEKDEVVDSGNPCIRYGEIYTKYNHKVDSVHSFINDDVSNTSLKIKGTHILLTGSGELSTEIGKAIVITLEEVFIGGDIIILKSGNDFDPFYLTYLINSECVRIQREISAKGEIIVHIYPKNFREMRFCCPPLTEQQQIVTYLDQRTKEIDELILIEKRRVDRLKEYRQSLISEVVTGKIKVTNV